MHFWSDRLLQMIGSLFSLLENMWGNYMKKSDILEKASLQSVDAHGAADTFGMYVSADIATSFTLLVGIFFPSATGKMMLPITKCAVRVHRWHFNSVWFNFSLKW